MLPHLKWDSIKRKTNQRLNSLFKERSFWGFCRWLRFLNLVVQYIYIWVAQLQLFYTFTFRSSQYLILEFAGKTWSSLIIPDLNGNERNLRISWKAVVKTLLRFFPLHCYPLSWIIVHNGWLISYETSNYLNTFLCTPRKIFV